MCVRRDTAMYMARRAGCAAYKLANDETDIRVTYNPEP